MARQPIEKLQGYGQTSSPSAAPIDSFTGAPAVPRETASTQLAQALNVMGGSVHRAGAKAAAKKKHEEEELAKITAAAQAEQSEGYVSKVQVGEGNPALSIINQASIAETAAQNRAYASTSALFQSFLSDDDLVGNPAEMNQRIAAHKASIIEATKDMPFAGAGAMKGFNNAQREMTPSVLSRQGKLLRAAGKRTVTDSVAEIAGKIDFSSPEGASDFMLRIQQKDDIIDKTYPNGKAERAAAWREGIVNHALMVRDVTVLETLRQGWLKESGEITDNRISQAALQITELAVLEMELKNKELTANLNEQKPIVESEIENLMSSGKRSDVTSIMSRPIPSDATPLQRALALHAKDYARIALTREYQDPGASNIRANELREDIKTAASTGDWSSLGFSEPPNNDQLRDLIGRDETLTQQDANLIRNNLSDFRKGFTSIREDVLRKEVAEQFRVDLQTYSSEINRGIFGLAGINAQQIVEETYINAMQAEFMDFYNDPKYETGVPEGAGVLGAMKGRATDKVRDVIVKLDSVLAAEGNKIENLKGFKQELTQGEQPDIELEVGKEYPSPDGGFVRYLGGDPEDDSSFEKVEEEDPRYKVTKETEGVRNTNPRNKARAEEKDAEAKSSVANIFDKESATFNLADDTLATLDKLVKGRYKRKASNPRSTGVQAVTEDDVMDIVLDQLGLAGISDFEYGGFFGDEADTAGEIAIKKIVDSLMEKHRGE
jgi:hypothetical protein